MEQQVKRLIIVDDHQIVIDGLCSLLNDIIWLEIAATTTDPTIVLQLIKDHHADLLLTDVMMPRLTGAALSKQVRHAFPSIKILALSMNGEGDIVNEMINEADINGYILKNIDKQALLEAISKVMNGGIYFSNEVLQELEKLSNRRRNIKEAQLTFREIEIIQLIEKELSNKDIADKLFISERTVETHRKNIYRKTKTSTPIGLIKYAYLHKIINDNS